MNSSFRWAIKRIFFRMQHEAPVQRIHCRCFLFRKFSTIWKESSTSKTVKRNEDEFGDNAWRSTMLLEAAIPLSKHGENFGRVPHSWMHPRLFCCNEGLAQHSEDKNWLLTWVNSRFDALRFISILKMTLFHCGCYYEFLKSVNELKSFFPFSIIIFNEMFVRWSVSCASYLLFDIIFSITIYLHYDWYHLLVLFLFFFLVILFFPIISLWIFNGNFSCPLM